MVSMKEIQVGYSGIQPALQELRCKQCGDGPVVFKEDLSFKHGQSIPILWQLLCKEGQAGVELACALAMCSF